MVRIITTLYLAILALVPLGPSYAAESPAIHNDYGMIVDAAETPAQGVRIKLWNPALIYSITELGTADRNSLVGLINRSMEGSRAITVEYAATAGVVDDKSDAVVFPLCSIALDREVLRFPGNCPKKPVTRLSPDASLGLAVASAQSGEFGQAVKLLSKLLAGNDLDPRRIRIARQARADAETGLATRETAWSLAADRHNLAALADYRALAQLTPDDVELQFSIGWALEELGDYAAAREHYAATLKRWPDQDYRVTVRLAAIERRFGNYAEALGALDGLVARTPPPRGMKLHYHRAWTLTLMQRYDEAITELNLGLKNQPDYAYAYVRRSCAQAGAGRLSEALRDIDQAAKLYAAIPHRPGDRAFAADGRRMAQVRSQLAKAVSRGENKSMPQICHGWWGRNDEKRGRSPLLP